MTTHNFLENILTHKAREVADRKQRCPETALRTKIEHAPPPRSLAESLSQNGLSVIAEIKKASPSAGVIREDFHPATIAQSYVKAGVNALSILTDEEFFQGSLDYIARVRELVPCPILRKDFIIDAYQLLEARSVGADAVLLIVAALTPDRLRTLLHQAHEIGLDALVEVHSQPELQIAIDVGAPIIGINNRNLESFVIDLATTEQLAPLAPEGTLLVGESGLRTGDDVQRMIQAGVDAVLVGTHFMKEPDPGLALQNFKKFFRQDEQD
jgi:indole-3-glycerol phosphate synthase